MLKKYVVGLSADERTQLEALIHTGNAPASTQTHARILLKADCSAGGPAWTDDRVAQACEVSRPTVERVRKTFATKGFAAALHRKKWIGPSRRKLDGLQEAQLIALACSKPPDGAERWTLLLLADSLFRVSSSLIHATYGRAQTGSRSLYQSIIDPVVDGPLVQSQKM